MKQMLDVQQPSDPLLDRSRYEFFGVKCQDASTEFRLYCPGATSVQVEIFTHIESSPEAVFELSADEYQVWYIRIDKCMKSCWARYLIDQTYRYADPFSHHVTTDSSYLQHPFTLLLSDDFPWDDQDWKTPSDHRDLILYECHVKDLVALSGSKNSGDYSKWLDENAQGGLSYIKELGVNAIELLPICNFAQQEPPYQIRTPEGYYNEWNRLETNHWGYMTSFFLAPESYYASDSTHESGYPGYLGSASTELKQLVNQCHKAGISVILDVVYNHSSIFDINIINDYLATEYMRYDESGHLMNRSGTGNEIKTESPAAKRLILDSILHWMKEYHVDGFRFDLAGLLDEQLWDEISESARSVNPNVILIAEPWGGQYRPHEFSEHGWASWNDKFRNGIKGQDPTQQNGFIFSNWIEGSSVFSLHNWLNGTHISGADGLFQDNRHAVNYLESHDGYTLGDYIRLVYRPELRSFFRYTDDEILPLRNEEMKIAKLAALALFTTPGIPMIHQGQEFANSKICRSFTFEDEGGVFLDHNSYEKDDPTNWLDFTRIQFNLPLYRFYKGLIEIRHHSPALRKADEKHAHFAHSNDPLHVIKYVHGGIHDLFDYAIGLNASTSNIMTVHLPGGFWELLSDGEIATIHALDFKQGVIEVPPKQGVLLRKLSQH